jgi:hypothetical protein
VRRLEEGMLRTASGRRQLRLRVADDVRRLEEGMLRTASGRRQLRLRAADDVRRLGEQRGVRPLR